MTDLDDFSDLLGLEKGAKIEIQKDGEVVAPTELPKVEEKPQPAGPQNPPAVTSTVLTPETSR